MPRKTFVRSLALLAALAAGASAWSLPLEIVGGPYGTPHQLSVEPAGDGLTLSGQVRSGLGSPSRRLLRDVKVAVLDDRGDVLAVYRADLHRDTNARHTRRASFSLGLGTLPAGAARLRVSY